MEYPIRINKYLAQVGQATRRGADLLIERKKVLVNGRLAKLGDFVQRGDRVEIKEVKDEKKVELVYFAYHKPRGEETSQISVSRISPEKIFPIGRLDKDSSGLLILTNDGRITERLLGPDHKHEKEYLVEVDKPVNGFMLKRMELGVKIEGYKTKKCQVLKIGPRNFKIILTEGKKHQIRRMCAAVGLQVRNLRRIRIMNIKLEDLKPGAFCKIVGKEKDELLKSLKLPF